MGRTEELEEDSEGISLNIFKRQKKELKKIALRDYEGNMAKMGRAMAEEFIKTHGDGNPVYVLDKWTENKDFEAVPALMVDPSRWKEHYENSDEKSRMKIRIQINKLIDQFQHVEFNNKIKFRRMKE